MTKIKTDKKLRGRPVTVNKGPVNKHIEKAIKLFGGATVLAKKLGISPSFVSEMLRFTKPLPLERALQIEKITDGKVKAKDLRPDIL